MADEEVGKSDSGGVCRLICVTRRGVCKMIRKRIYVLCIAETLILVFLSKVPFSSSLFVTMLETY